ncbi:MAG: 30S ribosomal protein S8 [Chlamydiales bacterium]
MDPIAEFLTRVRNAKNARHRHLEIRFSKMKEQIAKNLKDMGFIESYLVNEKQGLMRVFLKYGKDREPAIQGLTRLSKPGCRKYVSADQIPTVLGGIGSVILSTPKGVINGETAKRERVGGELLCKVW